MFDAIERLEPHSVRNNSEKEAFGNALTVFKDMARRVPAYSDFLNKQNVNAEKINSREDFSAVPKINKENYFSCYSPQELSWDGVFNTTHYVSTSSGSSGKPYLWPRSDIHGRIVGEIYRNVMENIAQSHTGSTLFIISFSFGQWIAGFELYNALNWTRSQGSKITIITSSIESSDVINKVSTLAHFYDRVVIAGYPPFVKDIIRLGTESGIDWHALDLYLLTAGEPFTEKWRDYMLSLIGKSNRLHSIFNLYGMSEAGIVAHETPKSILIRRFLDSEKFQNTTTLKDSSMTCLYQYYPTKRYFEVESDGSILLTTNADFPIVRYETRDMGGIHDFSSELENNDEFKQYAKEHQLNRNEWQLPFIYLHERKDFSVSLYGLNIYTENVKMSFDDSNLAESLSGLFTMEVAENSEMDQQLIIHVELKKNINHTPELVKAIETKLLAGLILHNSEYTKLYNSVGSKTAPIVKLVPFGEIETVRGKKHKWVKRSKPAK